MSIAHYVVLRLVPDPVRNEPVNAGILAWQGDTICIRTDEQALQRAVRRSESWAPDSLDELNSLVLDVLPDGWTSSPEQTLMELKHELAFQIDVTEPLRIFLTDQSAAASELSNHVDDLLDRLVRVHRRPRDRREPVLKPLLEELSYWIGIGKVVTDHLFQGAKSGIDRPVSFFANSTVNVALDALLVRRNASEEIVLREVGNQAAKVIDVRNSVDAIRDYLVYLPSDQLGAVKRVEREAEQLLSAVCDCTVITSHVEASRTMDGMLERART